MIATADIHWLAGYLDADGCFFATGGGIYRSCCPIIQVAASDEDLVQKAARLMGILPEKIVRPPKQKNHYKQQYRFYVGSTLAASWMMTLYPLLCQRRKERIKKILGIWRGI